MKYIDIIIKKLILKNKTLEQGIKYVFVGGVCTLLDFGLLFLLTHFCEVNYLVSSVISFLAATVLNYYLCIWWIFDVRTVQNRYREFIYYLIITGVGLSINTLVIWCLTEYLQLYFMVSKLSAACVTYWWNFWARKHFLHTKKQQYE
jgi:putative flippase GtrA